jgi:cephalosporin-C deacetylase-like acetyl esterase
MKSEFFLAFRRMAAIVGVLFGFALVHAENYPYRSDYLWVTVPDHADWVYKTGENATIEVQFYKYGIPRDAEVSYSIANDMLNDDARGKVFLKNGRAKINIGTRKQPGFRDLRLRVTVDGKEYRHHIKVGFSPEQIKPYTQEPKDFMTFWDANLKEMKNYPLTYTKELAKEYCTDKIDCYLVRLQLDNHGHCIYGYLTYPKNARKGACPVVMCPPGAGVKTIKEPLRHKYYAENGFIRFEIEIHGLNPTLSAEQFKEISNALNSGDNGYLQNGLDNRDNYYMKRVYLACVRSIDFLTSLPEWDGKNIAVQGGSQGGALSIITAGLDPRVTLCVANHPALSDMAGYAEEGRAGGYPHFNHYHQMMTKEKMTTMAYYDVVNFARHVKAKSYLTWGFNDDTCPPTTSYAVWNTLPCEKESLITPINEHWTSEATEYGHMEWIMKNLK